MFSQTGSEIVALSERLGRKPDIVITNNPDVTTYHPGILSLGSAFMSAKHDRLMSFLESGIVIDPRKTVITLHGYLRIIPKSVCDKYSIYNGHPGLITQYPELKGKDPQEKVIANMSKYPYIGSVVHRVVEEVDAGSICRSSSALTPVSSDEIYPMLRTLSLDAWESFLRNFDRSLV